MQKNDHITYDVVISGMGSAGLTAAWEALQQDKHVLILSNRGPEFLRVQRIYLNIELRDYLYAMVSDPHSEKLNPFDKKFLKNIYKEISLALKDVERFIFNRLNEMKNKGAKIDFVFHSELSEIDLKNGSATISPCENQNDQSKAPKVDRPIHFQYLIGADGVNRHALHVLNKNPDQSGIIINKTAMQPLRQHHVSAYLTIERVDNKQLNLSDRGMLLLTNDEYASGMLFDVASYNKSEKKSVKCSFTCELPDEIYDNAQNDHDLKKNTILFIENKVDKTLKHYQLDNGALKIKIAKNSQKYGYDKDKIKFLIFRSDITQASIASLTMNNHSFVLMGDAFRSSFYQIGHGVGNALKHAQTFALVLRGSVSLDEYNNICNEIAKEVDIRVQTIADINNRENIANIIENTLVNDIETLKMRVMDQEASLKSNAQYKEKLNLQELHLSVSDGLKQGRQAIIPIDKLDSLLIYSAEVCDWDMVEYLIKCGADVKAKNAHGITVLHMASEQGNRDLVKLLLTHKVEVNAKDDRGRTPLHYCATYYASAYALADKKADITQDLVSHGADVKIIDVNLMAPLDLAIEARNWKVVHQLAKLETDIGVLKNLFFEAIKRYQYLVVEELLAHKIDVNTVDENGKTGLFYAVSSPFRKAMVEVLKKNHANFNVKDNLGQTLLHAAIPGANLEQVKYLVENGVDLHAKDQNGTVLEKIIQLSSPTENLDIIEYLKSMSNAKVINVSNSSATLFQPSNNSSKNDPTDVPTKKF